MRLPAQNKTPLPSDLAGIVRATGEIIASAPSTRTGYVRATCAQGEAFLFIQGGKVHSAGEHLGDRFLATSVQETVNALREATEAAFYDTDLPLFLCTAVPFRKAPSAQIPLKLVDPETLLKSVRSMEKDSVLVVRRNDARSLVFCTHGEPKALYAAEGEPIPEGGSIADRIVEYVFAASGSGAVTLDIYDDIRLPPAADGGKPLKLYAERAGKGAAMRTLWLLVKLGDRAIFNFPVTTDEVSIGRGTDNDLVLDNLSVSRKHAKVYRKDEVLIVHDLGGANGLSVRDKRVKTASLKPNDEVQVGKYTLVHCPDPHMSVPAAPRPKGPGLSAIEPTIAMNAGQDFAVLEYRGQTHKLNTIVFNIGTDEHANLRISGLWIAPIHIQIMRQQDGSYRVRHAAGRRKVRRNGQAITTEGALAPGDELRVAGHRFAVRKP